MKSDRLTKSFFILAACFLLIPIHAQVTIGSGKAPSRAALLEIKDQEPDLQNVTSTKGGLALPRVSLVNTATLEPFIATTDADWTNTTTQADLKKIHVGLMVYNLNTTLPFTKGIYVWTGEKWTVASVFARNGLKEQDGYIQMGGGLTLDMTTIVADNKKLIFDLKNIPEDTRESGFMIKGLKEQANSIAVVADAVTGRLGLSQVIPARLAFIQSGTETLNPDAINTSGEGFWVVSWDERDANMGGDVITNNGVLEFNSSSTDGDHWVMNMDAMVEISGMVGYRGGTGSNNSVIVINSTIQIKKLNGANAGLWKDYSSVRGVFSGTVNAYRNTLNIPPAMAELEEGDAIRMILARAPGTGAGTENGFLGNNHLTGGSTNPATHGIV
ncbi:MAG: hypothetical protein LBT43_03140, partial [Prevotella sp.]|nr:hypothetical protein [Prevotella sp.]